MFFLNCNQYRVRFYNCFRIFYLKSKLIVRHWKRPAPIREPALCQLYRHTCVDYSEDEDELSAYTLCTQFTNSITYYTNQSGRPFVSILLNTQLSPTVFFARLSAVLHHRLYSPLSSSKTHSVSFTLGLDMFSTNPSHHGNSLPLESDSTDSWLLPILLSTSVFSFPSLFCLREL